MEAALEIWVKYLLDVTMCYTSEVLKKMMKRERWEIDRCIVLNLPFFNT